MVNFIDTYSFIPVSGCIDMGTSAMPFPVAYNDVKTALGRRVYNLEFQSK